MFNRDTARTYVYLAIAMLIAGLVFGAASTGGAGFRDGLTPGIAVVMVIGACLFLVLAGLIYRHLDWTIEEWRAHQRRIRGSFLRGVYGTAIAASATFAGILVTGSSFTAGVLAPLTALSVLLAWGCFTGRVGGEL